MNRVGAPEIRAILAVTDALGIHRESVRVPLTGRGEGSLRVTEAAVVEIVVPADGDLGTWLAGLPLRLEGLDLGGVRRVE